MCGGEKKRGKKEKKKEIWMKKKSKEIREK